MSSQHVSEADDTHEEEMRSATRVAVVTGVARLSGIGHAVSQSLLDQGLAVIGLDCRPLDVSSPLRSRDKFRFKTASVRDHCQVYGAVRDGLRELGESSVSVVVNNAAISDPFMKSRPAGGGGAAGGGGSADEDDQGAASGTEDAEISEASNERGGDAGGGGDDGGGHDENDDDRNLGAVTARLDEFDAYTATNLRSAFLVTEVCRPFFPPRPGPGETTRGDVSVIHIGSTRARQSEREGSEGYASAKAGLVGLMHSQGQSLAGRARVNVVSPGWIDTEDDGECIVTERDRRWHAAGRVGTPADVAELVSFLADDEKSGFITCEEFVIDGGVNRRMYYPG